jgi:hypothetical protein
MAKRKKTDYPVTEKDFDVNLKLAGMIAAGLAKKFADLTFTLDPSFEIDSTKWAGVCCTLSDAQGNLEVLSEMLPQFYKIAEKRMVAAQRQKKADLPLDKATDRP